MIRKSTSTALLLITVITISHGQMMNPIMDWESLPVIRAGVKIKAYSSTNPTGRTMRDFRNYTTENDKGFELANLEGVNGMLVHLWLTAIGGSNQPFGPGRFGRLNFYFSGSDFPAFIKERDLYFNRLTYTFPHPLWDTYGPAQWAFPCLGFSGRFLAASSETPHWFQFTCHLYREDRFSEKIDPDDLYQVNNRLIDYRGRFPGTNRGNRLVDHQLILQPGSLAELFNHDRQGVIRSIQLSVSTLDNAVIDQVWVIVDYGVVEKKVIEVPLPVFFGGYAGAPVTNAMGMPCGYDGREFYFFFPMPFWEGCTLALMNRSDKSINIDSHIRYSDINEYQPSGTGKFYIQYNDQIHMNAGEPDFVHLGKKGAGTIVGTTANLAGSIEGNFSVYIDGSKTPSIETTGGEDYFCNAFGIDVGLCTPFHGGLNDKIGYRFHIIDYIPFLSSVRFTQDHGHESLHDRDGIFQSAVFYYWNIKPMIMETDSIDIGKTGDEKKHKYHVLGSRDELRNDEGCYEGNYNSLFSDDGRWFDGSEQFTVKINSENDGIRLRKRINQCNFHQESEVYIDGEYAGKWFEQGSNYRLFKEPDPENHPGYKTDWKEIKSIFRDTEFEIPVQFTKNKKQIEITIKVVGAKSVVNPADDGLCNSYFYRVYSYAGK